MSSFALLTNLSKLNLISLISLGKPSNVDGMMKVSWSCSHCLCCVCVCVSEQHEGFLAMFSLFVLCVCVSEQHEGFLAMFSLFVLCVCVCV